MPKKTLVAISNQKKTKKNEIYEENIHHIIFFKFYNRI